jgi:hypothetical protein
MPPLSRDKQRVAELLEDKHRQFHQAILARRRRRKPPRWR